ncbi:adenosine deaminase [Hasllibacter halocynthiae]|uniref:Adenosine deaminase n=1 Tax=Hasllibacter halocynthiae TaxID=595589 RepID=A0A2T0X6F3_9RHOB|nr:adenosine deaminase [Hasllibacter halocynthiae]PRY94509.1 adenosine deaminase [Hasllibacter halocynthiae]
MNWRDAPKVELHLHLEGAAPPTFIQGLAEEQGIDLRGVVDRDGYRWNGFAGFLRCYEAATSVLRGPREFGRLTAAVLEDLERQGAVYAEVFLSPAFCGGGDLAAWREHLAAMEEAAHASPVEMRGIVTCIRHEGPEAAKRSALCAAETGDGSGSGFVTGFGMGGDERVGRQQDFAWSFDCAREAGLGLTTHAGEWRGAEEVRDALALGVSRIGHGIRAAEDPALTETLAERGTVLEVCPGSNVVLGASGPLEGHPIERLRAAGVPVTVSTDDPPFFGTTLTKEWEGLERAFGWDEGDLRALNEVALRAAFCDEVTKDAIRKRLSEWTT